MGDEFIDTPYGPMPVPRTRRPDPRELDQETAFVRGFATVTWAYYAALVAQGFTPDQALALTGQWQSEYIAALLDADG